MSAGKTNIIEIIESGTELWADERVGGRIKLTSDTVGLEAEDTSSDVVHIVSQSSDNGVSFDGGAGNFLTGKRVPESLPALGVSVLLAGLAEAVARSNEGVLSIAARTGNMIRIMECYLLGITTSDFLLGVSPIVVLTDSTLGTVVAHFIEYLRGVELFRVGSELGTSHGLNFFSGFALDGASFFNHSCKFSLI